MNKRIALLFGSTGLIGGLLLEELIKSELYSSIKIFVRQPTGISEKKVEEIVMDFSNLGKYSHLIKGDDLYICLGSTIRKAGSVEKFGNIDRDLPVKIAIVARKNGAIRVAVVSSIGAKTSSRNYYLRVKGEMEQGISRLNFDQVMFARPSLLLGDRKERRIAETVSKVFMKIFSPLFSGKLKKYKAIEARDVALAMISVMESDSLDSIYESDELINLAENYRQKIKTRYNN